MKAGVQFREFQIHRAYRLSQAQVVLTPKVHRISHPAADKKLQSVLKMQCQ